MQDSQVKACLETWSGFNRGVISFDKPNESNVGLESILEPTVADKYFLSAKACRGILRRSKKRGKTLPEHLHRALEEVAAEAKESAIPEAKTA